MLCRKRKAQGAGVSFSHFQYFNIGNIDPVFREDGSDSGDNSGSVLQPEAEIVSLSHKSAAVPGNGKSAAGGPAEPFSGNP